MQDKSSRNRKIRITQKSIYIYYTKQNSMWSNFRKKQNNISRNISCLLYFTTNFISRRILADTRMPISYLTSRKFIESRFNSSEEPARYKMAVFHIMSLRNFALPFTETPLLWSPRRISRGAMARTLERFYFRNSMTAKLDEVRPCTCFFTCTP